MEMNLKSMVTTWMSLLAMVSYCVHAGTLVNNSTEIYAHSVVEFVD